MLAPVRTLIFILAAAPALLAAGDIDRDVRLRAGVHVRNRPLRVVADGVTLDLGDAILEGPAVGGAPDAFRGVGIHLKGRRGVTIRGGRLRGFRCAILLQECEDVVLEGIDVSGNFRQRLRSTPEREDPSDWLRPHDNDAQEWRRRYGAGICLEGCRRVVVRRCTGRRQQNGVLLDRSTECEVYDNDMSFLSGWGVALWRSSRNVVSRNRFDWCVRGYSHGVYARGQDSAGILVFEQCNENRFLYNSATHSGDGFFLYAGEETVRKTGRGGSNFNLVHGNDFSHAVANAIEATFSRGNRFVDNRCDDSNYGVWAGYSYETVVARNTFRSNSIAGVAIEHGAKNSILGNSFERNPRGIWLWWDNDEDLLKSAFGKTHPCRSRDYTIADNSFLGEKTAILLQDTTDVRLFRNRSKDVREVVRKEGASEVSEGVEEVEVSEGVEEPEKKPKKPEKPEKPEEPEEPEEKPEKPEKPKKAVDGRWSRPVQGPGERDPFLPAGHPRGRRHIMIDEWGPLDPTAPGVFPARVVGWGACRFRVVGGAEYTVSGLPAGLGVERDGSTFRVTGGGPGLHEFSGEVKVAGGRFPVSGLLLNARWRIRHWRWRTDPREDAGAWAALLETAPLADRTTDRLDYAWRNGAPAPGVPADRFATRAETTVVLPAGRYEVRTVSDDGVRVRIDGKVVLEDWTWHAPRESRTVVALAPGRHAITVEHFEIDGYAALSFDLRPVK